MLINLINQIKQLSRKQKQFLMVGADAVLLLFALWIGNCSGLKLTPLGR